MDDELRQQLQALTTLVESVKESQERKIEALSTLVENVKESLEREIGTVGETVQRMETRLDKIAAGAHYVTRLVEWSEAQDTYQRDILQRVQALESRLDKMQGKMQG
ncbi:MAG: hypothetical protein LAQ69_01110 [Acidobacteriia bacterium]|nr:hypothetical protein [Terriglobia bacterium]